MADFFIITNNEMVRDKYAGEVQVEFHAVHYTEIMRMARDYIHAGHKLLTHPLAGSVKPNETPYKSLIVSLSPHGFDAVNAELIANAIGVCDKFKPLDRTYSESVLRDFQLIDYSLLAGAIGFDAQAGLSK